MGTLASGSIDLKSLKVAGEPNKYITQITGEGIKVHDAGAGGTDFLKITSNGVFIYNGGPNDSNKIAEFSSYFTIGTRSTNINAAVAATSITPGTGSACIGQSLIAQGDYSFASGYGTEAVGSYSHAEGTYTYAIGQGSHAEGSGTYARGDQSHVGGLDSETLVTAPYSFAHGNHVTATAGGQAVFGKWNEDDLEAMFVIGNGTGSSARSNLMTVGDDFIRIGNKNQAHIQFNSDSITGVGKQGQPFFHFAEGEVTLASAKRFNERISCYNQSQYTYTIDEVLSDISTEPQINAWAWQLNNNMGDYVDAYFTPGVSGQTTANVEFYDPNNQLPNVTHIDNCVYLPVTISYDGNLTIQVTWDSRLSSWANAKIEFEITYNASRLTPIFEFGENAEASGAHSYAMGLNTIASGNYSVAMGASSKATKTNAVALGGGTASGINAISLGGTASGNYSIAAIRTTAKGQSSCAYGDSTIAAKRCQTVLGTFNIEDTATTTIHPMNDNTFGQYALIIGNGRGAAYRSNAFMVDWLGDIYPQATKMVDFVVDQGTTGIWTYRKWNSGIAECWGKWSGTISNYYSSGTGLYGYKIDNLTFPSSLFNAEPIVTTDGYIGAGFYMGTRPVVSGSGTSWNVQLVAMGTASGSVSAYFYVSAKGTWK